MHSLKSTAVPAAILAAISTSPLYAQGPTPPSTQRDCLADVVQPPRSGETTERAPLGERLSESKGVICPPKGVDPGIIEKPPPGNATMPVIPPLEHPAVVLTLSPSKPAHGFQWPRLFKSAWRVPAQLCSRLGSSADALADSCNLLKVVCRRRVSEASANDFARISSHLEPQRC
jgi:hypothetical protein